MHEKNIRGRGKTVYVVFISRFRSPLKERVAHTRFTYTLLPSGSGYSVILLLGVSFMAL
jgi:hypothetical protein